MTTIQSRGSIVCLKREVERASDCSRSACEIVRRCGQTPCNVICSDTFNGFALRGVMSEDCKAWLTESGVVDHIEDDIQVQAAASVPWGIESVGGEESSVAGRKEGDAGDAIIDVDVFVLDTGVEKSHPYLNVVNTVSVLDSETETDDLNGHGTLCAGIIGAWKQETDGMVGVAPGARIHGVKVLDRDGNGFLSDIITGVEIVARFKKDHPTKRVLANLSLGGYTGSTGYTALDYEIMDTIDKFNVPFIVAAGNSSDDARLYTPAHVKEAVTVGSFDRWNRFSSFSNHGLAVDVLAPGTDIFSTSLNGGTATASGTSFAAPFVAGAIALVMHKKGSSAAEAKAQEVLGRILSLSGSSPPLTGVPQGTPRLSVRVSEL